MKAISTITIMPFTIEQRADYVNQVVNDFNHLPEHEQAKIFIHLKAVVETLEAIQKHPDVRAAIIDRMENKKLESTYGEISYSERKNYKFDHCPNYNALKEQIKALETKMKATESELVDTATGEVIQPAIVTASEVLTVKMK
jgi:hypothetical protein